MKEKSVRNMVVTPESGKDIRNTQVLTGTASKSSVESASNETKQYTTGAAKKGALGGENTNS